MDSTHTYRTFQQSKHAMCGISGIVRKDGGPVCEDRIRRMTDLVTHRGPDDYGLYFDTGLAIGHRRLAIIDLNLRGRQPMSFRGRYWITYNGEVYNYLELRRELEHCGVKFRTTTDTEVVLAAYEVWGADCLSRFNGMWAFVIYDRVERQLFLARDRFGIKPLYYTETLSEFAFGSELKQLVSLQERVRANQWVVVESLLTYFDGHTDQTFFSGIHALPQSHYMVYDLENSSYTFHRYYDLRIDQALHKISLNDAVERLRGILADSISIRLRSDVKVGTCLSGGLDSSAISALASGQYCESTGRRFTGIHAKSIEKHTDESDIARIVAERAGIDLTVVEPSTTDFVNTIDEVVYTQEEPFGSPSMFMGWHVFQEAKLRNCQVMLNGQGGDEVLLGYERYYPAILKNLSAFQFVREAWKQANNSKLSFVKLLQYYIYFTNPRFRSGRLKSRSYLIPSIKDTHNFEYVERSAESYRTVEDLQKYEICTLQLPHLLRYEDRNSMRHSIETRLPFLDYRLVETAISLSVNYKIQDGWTKFVLRKAVADILPNDVVWRKNKLGFEAPVRIWLSMHEDSMKNEIARSRILNEIADQGAIIKNFHSLSLKERWAYFNLAVWERVYGVSWD